MIRGERYGKVPETFWTDPGIRALTEGDQRVLLYLTTNAHRNLAGCYRLPPLYAVTDLQLSIEAVREALERLHRYVSCDPETDECWVHDLASVNMNHEATLPLTTAEGKKPDNRMAALLKAVRAIASPTLRRRWLEYYHAWALDLPVPPVSPASLPSSEAPSEGLPSSSEANSSSKSKSSSTHTNASHSATPGGGAAGEHNDELEQASTWGAIRDRIAGAVKKIWWAPDGRPPKDWDMARELGIWKQLHTEDLEECLRAIHGAELLREHGGTWWRTGEEYVALGWMQAAKLTARIFNNTHAGAVPIWTLALDAHHREPPRRSGKNASPLSPSSVTSLADLVHVPAPR